MIDLDNIQYWVYTSSDRYLDLPIGEYFYSGVTKAICLKVTKNIYIEYSRFGDTLIPHWEWEVW